MGTEVMGRVVTTATIENLSDLYLANAGAATDEDIRRVTVDDALVDTGATLLSLPTRLIKQLGLKKVVRKPVISGSGATDAWLHEAVRLTVLDRFCTVDVLEVPDDVPPLIGQIPLELLDFVVDPRGQRLIGNPRHNGEHVFEQF